MSQDPIRRDHERMVYENQFATIFDDDVIFTDGTPGRYLRIEPPGEGPGAVVLPIRMGAVGLVRTFRYPLGDWQWALPRGFSHAGGPLETAREELFEEMGVADAAFKLLGAVTPDSGLLANRVAIVLAVVGDSPLADPEDDEVAEVRWVSITDLFSEVAAGDIEDGFTLAAICLAQVLGILPPPPAP